MIGSLFRVQNEKKHEACQDKKLLKKKERKKKEKREKHECYYKIIPRREISTEQQVPITSYVLLNKIPSISDIQVSWN